MLELFLKKKTKTFIIEPHVWNFFRALNDTVIWCYKTVGFFSFFFFKNLVCSEHKVDNLRVESVKKKNIQYSSFEYYYDDVCERSNRVDFCAIA